MSKLASLSLLALTTTLSLAACRNRDDNDDVVELTADSSNASQAEGSLLSATLEGANGASNIAPASAESAAAYIAAHAPTSYMPSGCAVATQSGVNVSIVFTGCTGPRGLREVNGMLKLVVTPATGGAVSVDATASQLQIGGAVLDIDASATYATSGGSSSLDVETHTTGIGPLGYAIAHDGNYALTWDASCVSIDGAWSSERGDIDRSTVATLRRCLDACPTGSVTRETVRDRTFTLTFDGTDTGAWSSSAGASGTFPLACGL